MFHLMPIHPLPNQRLGRGLLGKKKIKKYRNDSVKFESLIHQTHEDAKRIANTADKFGLSVYLEFSGYKGAHCWMFFKEKLKANSVRNLAKKLLRQAGKPSDDLHWEIFPKQDFVPEGGLGNLIKIPLGIHKKTGQRCLFVNREDFTPYPDQLGFLKEIKLVDTDSVNQAISKLNQSSASKKVEEFKHPTAVAESQKQSVQEDSVDRLSYAQVDTEPSVEDIKKIESNCHVVKSLIEKAKDERHLEHNERLAFLYVFPQLGEEGKAYLHEVISCCDDYDYEYTQRMINSAKSNPVGCPKLKRWLSEVGEEIICNCEPPQDVYDYPTPASFAVTQEKVKRPDATTEQSEDAIPKVVTIDTKIKGEIPIQEEPYPAKLHSPKPLYQQFIEPQNLWNAWIRIEENGGCAGVDGETIADFRRNLADNLPQIHRELENKMYRPSSLKRAYIPKSDGSRRPLAIPTVRDRIVQTALRLTLESRFESAFRWHSYGYRPNRALWQAIAEIQKQIKEGKHYVIDADIKSCFDSIDRDLLIQFILKRVDDEDIISLIKLFLQVDILEEGRIISTETGTPQGSPFSPLLSNIYLHEFDRKMAKNGLIDVRYADDFVVLCENLQAAQKAFSIVEMLLGELRLTLHPEKTQIVNINDGFKFLGYEFRGKWVSLVTSS